MVEDEFQLPNELHKSPCSKLSYQPPAEIHEQVLLHHRNPIKQEKRIADRVLQTANIGSRHWVQEFIAPLPSAFHPTVTTSLSYLLCSRQGHGRPAPDKACTFWLRHGVVDGANGGLCLQGAGGPSAVAEGTWDQRWKHLGAQLLLAVRCWRMRVPWEDAYCEWFGHVRTRGSEMALDEFNWSEHPPN